MKLDTRLRIMLAGEEGFEPSLPGPEPGVLPLDYSPATSQQNKKIEQKIQSLLSNPRYYQSISHLVPKYQLRQLRPAGILLASTTRGWGYNIITDNGNESIPLAAPPTPRGTIPRSADETQAMMAPSTLPESVTEVASC